MQQLDALVLAGAPPEAPDPLAVIEGVPRKALIDIHGRPMLRWVLRALRGSGRVNHLIVLGGEPEDIAGVEGPIECLSLQGKLLDNVLAGLQRLIVLNPKAELALIACCDTPLLTPAMVNYFIDACLAVEADFYYPIVERSVMEGRFPGSARTFVPLRDGRFCGGDMVMVRVNAALTQQELIRDLLARRKSPWRQARLIGVSTLIKFLLRRLSLAEAERIGSRALGIRGKAIISPYAELGMDVDKPHQLAIARQALAARLVEAA